MKKIKCLFMVILTLGFFALSANAQDAREVRKQERAKKMKARKTLKARPNPVRQAKVITYKKQVVVQVKPSDKPSKKGEFKKRPNPTKSTELTSTVTVTTNRGERSVRKPFKHDSAAAKQRRMEQRKQRMSGSKFDKNTLRQKAKERRSNQ